MPEGLGSVEKPVPGNVILSRCEMNSSGFCGKEKHMQLHQNLPAIIALVAGILIFVRPRLLSLIVSAYLIIVGLLGLFGPGGMRI
jgi:hypothetical protein